MMEELSIYWRVAVCRPTGTCLSRLVIDVGTLMRRPLCWPGRANDRVNCVHNPIFDVLLVFIAVSCVHSSAMEHHLLALISPISRSDQSNSEQ